MIVIISLLIIAGFVFIAIELFIVPGFSIPGLAGLGMVGYGIFMTHEAYGPGGALIATAISALTAFIVIITAVKSRSARIVRLDYSEKDVTAVDDYSYLVGRKGETLSILRPSGMAIIDGKRYDVVADGDYVEKDSPVEVSAVDGRRIIVNSIQRG